MTAYRQTRNRGGEYSKKTDHSDVSRVNTRIRRTFSKFEMNCPQSTNNDVKNCEVEEDSQNSSKKQWCELSEVVDSDFLISPGDIYPNRKVELEDADIKEATRVSFEALCEQQHEAFSKNNKDIGRTQLIEMEIDTGDSLPVAQSPYTLPLKHYDSVRQEIETLE